MQTFEATSWEMSIDFSIDYESEKAAFARADWQIYLLMHPPESIKRKQF